MQPQQQQQQQSSMAMTMTHSSRPHLLEQIAGDMPISRRGRNLRGEMRIPRARAGWRA